MKSRLSFAGWPCLALAVLGACTAPASQPAGSPEDRPSLAGALAVEERTHDGDEHAIVPTRHLAPVDFRSRVVVDPDKEKLRQLVEDAQLSDEVPAESPEETEELLETRRLLESLEEYVRLSRRVDLRVQAMRSEELAASVEAIAELEEAVRARAAQTEQVVSVLMSTIEDYAEAQGHELDVDPETGDFLDPETEAFIFDLEDRLLPDGEPLSIPVATELIQYRIQQLERRVQQDRAALERGELAQRLKMVAYLVNRAGERTRLHIENYDTLETGGGIAPKTLLGISEKRWEEVRRRFELSADWAKFFNHLRESDSDLRQRLRDFGRELKDKLGAFVKQLGDRLESYEVGDLEELATLLEQNGAGDDLVASLRRLAERLRDLQTAFGTVRAEVEQILRALDQSRMNDPSEVFRFARQVSSIPARLGEVVDSVKAVAADIAALDVEAAISGLAPAVQDTARELMGQVRTFGIDALREAVPLFEDYPAVSGFVTALGRELESGGFLMGLTNDVEREDIGAGLPQDVIARPIDQVLPGAFSLNDLASPGERVEVVTQVVGPQDGAPPLVEHRQAFDVIGRGFYPTLESHVIFANRQGRPSAPIIGGVQQPNDDDQSFQAAPAASWTMHYRKEEETEEADGWAPFWNGLDPGLGLNVAALNFEDESVEVGVGGHVTFFGDLLQVGYGWNLSVGEKREYFFLGIGLVEALNVAGLGNIDKRP